MINQVVNHRYEAIEKLGESSLFSVYKAREKSANRFVALKAVQPAYAKDAAFMDGLQIGTEAASHLNHPNIASVQELGMEGDAPYLVTEFVRGINLKERIRRIAPFTLSVAIDFACGVSEALHYAHSLGQSHGDLRPQNIIISPEGAVKITDFGVQQAISASAKAQRDILKLSASYHAPELSTTRPGTAAGDIYALGAILYEMLTGTPLYSGATPEDIADQHAFSAIPSPRSINSGVPTSVVGIMLKCLQKKPEERYASAAELLNDLRSVRDALRFGKSLSWSPVDIEKLSAAPPRPAPPIELPRPKPIIKPKPAPPPPLIMEPVADVAASSQALPMPARSRIREQDDRVSLYIKIPLLFVTGVIIVCLVIFGGIWSSSWVSPKVIPAPQLIGRPIDDVRAEAKTLGVKLIEHHEFNAKPRKIVYKVDKELGAQLRKGSFINVWFSDGPQYVNVPKLKGLNRDDAEKKIAEAGLTLGKVTTKNSETVPQSCVISQSGQVRVLHDTAIDLVVSDGPEVAAGQEAPLTPVTPDPAPPAPPATIPETGPNPGPPPSEAPHDFNRHIVIQRDGLGTRTVRIEYDDSIGTKVTIDEPHAEGDRIPVQFTYYGKTIKLRIYYNDELKKSLNFDPQSSRREIR